MFQLKNKKEKEMAKESIESIKSIREVLVKEQEEKLMNENKDLLEQLIEQKLRLNSKSIPLKKLNYLQKINGHFFPPQISDYFFEKIMVFFMKKCLCVLTEGFSCVIKRFHEFGKCTLDRFDFLLILCMIMFVAGEVLVF